LRPYVALPEGESATGGDEEKNGGISSDLNLSVCGTAVAAERLDGRLCLWPVRSQPPAGVPPHVSSPVPVSGPPPETARLGNDPQP
jgi:hypothetical protein